MEAGNWISVSNSHHYALDGVPMRINGIFQHRLIEDSVSAATLPRRASSNALKFSYSFETEEGYMQWYNDYVMAKKNSAEEREKRKKLKDASKSAVVSKPAENRPNADVAASGSASNESPLKPSNIEVKAEVKLPVVSNIVLKPERFSPTATVQNSSPRNSVNVRDFENLGEDPFDNLELKTIDDMEELKSVLVFSDSGKYGAVAAETHRSEDVNTSSQNPFENVQTNSTAQSSCADNKHFDAIAAGNEAEQKDESIYANAETIGPRVQKQRSSEVGSEGNSALKSHKLPMPSPRLSLNSDIILSEDPTTAADRQSSSYVSETAEVLSNQTPTSADTADIKEHSEQEKPVVKAKPPVKEKPVVKEKPTIKAKPPMKGKAINRELPAKESATRESRTAHLSSMIEQLELNKDTSVARYTPKGFSYFQPSAAHSETVKEIEWPSLERCESRDNDTAESTGTRSGKLPISPNSITRNPLSRSDQVKRNHLDHNLDLQNIPCQPATHLPSLANGSAAPMAEATKQMKRKPARPPPPVPETNRKSGPSKPAPASGQSAVASDNEDTDQVVTSLLAMGFTKSLVDSAVKKYGVDTKKLVDHLCAVENMKNTGVKSSSAQEALFLFDDYEKANKFVRPYERLLEFGFEAERVKKALIKSDMDPEKALDELVT